MNKYSLTEREADVVYQLYLTSGKNADLAKDLNISVDTVKTHLRKVFRKMHVISRVQLVGKINKEVTPDYATPQT